MKLHILHKRLNVYPISFLFFWLAYASRLIQNSYCLNYNWRFCHWNVFITLSN